MANWIAETVHPAHGPEACGISMSITPDIYYASSSNKGGKLILDMSMPRSWNQAPSTIFIESDVLSAPHQMTSGGSEMIPVGGGPSYSTYHVEIPADNITGDSSTVNHEFWVIPQYNGYDYTNTFGVTNGAGTDKLASFFRYDLFVSATPYYNGPPICDLQVTTPMPYTGSGNVYFDASGSYSPQGSPLSFMWDFNGDGIFGGAGDNIDSGTAEKPMHHYTADYAGNVNLRVSDGYHSTTCSAEVDVTVLQNIILLESNINLGDGLTLKDIACDPSQDAVAINYDKTNIWQKFTNYYADIQTFYTPYSWMSNWDASSDRIFSAAK